MPSTESILANLTFRTISCFFDLAAEWFIGGLSQH